MNRRSFLHLSGAGLAALALASSRSVLNAAPGGFPPVAVFSKVYQELKLDYEKAAALTAAAGLAGIDCPVRRGGEVLPEMVGEDLPRYAAALEKQGCKVLLLTTDIQGLATPHTEKILRTARKLGVRHYRLGPQIYARNESPEPLIREAVARLKDLSALNRELGLMQVFLLLLTNTKEACQVELSA
jgi:sugar phosphate isomerase/epimerase